MGTFCLLCQPVAPGIRLNYIAAGQDEQARCEVCQDTIGLTAGVFTGIGVGLFLLIIVVFLLVRSIRRKGSPLQRATRSTVACLEKFSETTRPVNKLKICLGFYMIVCKVTSVYVITLPPIVTTVMIALDDVLSFGLDHLLTPLECIGLSGYVAKLTFWVLLAPAGIVVLFIVLFLWLMVELGKPSRVRRFWEEFGQRFVSLGVRLLFLFYPVVSTVAFEAFACYDFEEEGRWLIVDVSIDCNSDGYILVSVFAGCAVLAFPVGVMVTVGVLLYIARKTILNPKDPAYRHVRWLSEGLSFLYREYKYVSILPTSIPHVPCPMSISMSSCSYV